MWKPHIHPKNTLKAEYKQDIPSALKTHVEAVPIPPVHPGDTPYTVLPESTPLRKQLWPRTLHSSHARIKGTGGWTINPPSVRGHTRRKLHNLKDERNLQLLQRLFVATEKKFLILHMKRERESINGLIAQFFFFTTGQSRHHRPRWAWRFTRT